MADQRNDEDKERLNNNEFGELIPHLPLQDMLMVEFFSNSWFMMVYETPKKSYGCNICGATVGNCKNLYAHIEGKKHKQKMQLVKQLYHPEYTYSKAESKLAAGSNVENKATRTNVENKTTRSNLVTEDVLEEDNVIKSTSSVAENKSTPRKIPVNLKSKTLLKVTVAAKDSESPKTTTAPSTPKAVNATNRLQEKPLPSSVGMAIASVSAPVKTAVKGPVKNILPTNNIVNSAPVAAAKPLNKDAKGIRTNLIKIPLTPKSGKNTTVTAAPVVSNTSKTNISQKKVPMPGNITTTNTQSPKLTTPTKIINPAEKQSSIKSMMATLEQKKALCKNQAEKLLSQKGIVGGSNTTSVDVSANEDCMIEVNNVATLSKSKNTSTTTDTVEAARSSKNSEKMNEKSVPRLSNIVKNPLASKLDAKQKGQSEIKKIAKISCVPLIKLTAIPKIEDIPTVISSEVIVIDDDVCTDTGKNESIDEISPTLEEAPGETVAAADSDEAEPLSKRQKIVVNPAAAYLEKASESDLPEKVAESEENADKPKYQSDIVIIPTVHKKTKDPPMQISEPKFSTKTFSSKPSDNDVHGLIGVEYVVKILKSREDTMPKYECGLCELVLDGFAMQNHLVGYNHRLKFCEKHFPTAIRQYRQYMGKIAQHEVFKVMTPILAKLSIAIEQHHGRDLPYECLERDFNVKRHEILSKVFSCRHASEQYGPTFTHVVDSKEIDKFIEQKDTYKPNVGTRDAIFDKRLAGSTSQGQNKTPPRRARQRHPVRDPPPAMPPHNMYHQSFPVHPQFGLPYRPQVREEVGQVDVETHKLMVEDFLRGTNKGSYHSRQADGHNERERRMRRSRSRSLGRNRNRNRARSRSNSRNESNIRKSISPLRNNDIWQAYRHVVNRKLNELSEAFKVYRKDPEAHPMYNEEWQKFWKRRKDELIAAGLDHRTYNYQPEWVRYFEVRVEELYSQDIENVKIQSRERLCLPMTNHDLTDAKYHVHVEIVPPTISAVEEPEPEPYKKLNIECTSEVISVLRLLTALEEYLGSLGPRIIELLSKALQTEKSNPGQLNSIILTMENCTLLETAMEKFKGLVIAGLLEGSKERALKKAIQEVEAVLIIGVEERKRNPPVVSTPRSDNRELTSSTMTSNMRRPVPIQPAAAKQMQKKLEAPAPPSISNSASYVQTRNKQNTVKSTRAAATSAAMAPVDKKEIAAKIAAALTAQGKTDFDPEQLQQLVTVCTLLEKKKREAANASATGAPSKNPSNQKTLSDTLAGFLNPSAPSSGSPVDNNNPSNANQTYSTQNINNYVDMMRRSVGTSRNDSSINAQAARNNQSTSNASSLQSNAPLRGDQTYSSATINSYVDMMRHSGGGGGGTGQSPNNNMWQDLQNIQQGINVGSSNTSNSLGCNNSNFLQRPSTLTNRQSIQNNAGSNANTSGMNSYRQNADTTAFNTGGSTMGYASVSNNNTRNAMGNTYNNTTNNANRMDYGGNLSTQQQQQQQFGGNNFPQGYRGDNPAYNQYGNNNQNWRPNTGATNQHQQDMRNNQHRRDGGGERNYNMPPSDRDGRFPSWQ